MLTATIVGTQSRSTEMRFASRDSLSKMPRIKIRIKRASFHRCSFNGRALGESTADLVDVGTSSLSSFLIMIAQQTQAAITTTRLTDTVVRSVRRRDGARSTQRPKDEAKSMMATLVVIPLTAKVRRIYRGDCSSTLTPTKPRSTPAGMQQR